MNFDYNPQCIIISECGNEYNKVIEDWINLILESTDDPTMLVKMAGYYNSVEKLKSLVRKL